MQRCAWLTAAMAHSTGSDALTAVVQCCDVPWLCSRAMGSPLDAQEPAGLNERQAAQGVEGPARKRTKETLHRGGVKKRHNFTRNLVH